MLRNLIIKIKYSQSWILTLCYKVACYKAKPLLNQQKENIAMAHQPVLSTAQLDRFSSIVESLDSVFHPLNFTLSYAEGNGLNIQQTVEGLGGIIAQVKDALSELQALKVEANSNL